MNTAIKVLVGLTLAVILAASGFIGGFVYGNTTADPVADVSVVEASSVGDKVEEVADLIGDKGLNRVNESSATAGAVQGLLDSTGDKYGLYFDKRHYQYMNEGMNGEFGGIGVVLGEKDGTAYVVEVYKDTPAEKAGLKPEDIFVQIDGTRRDRWSTDEVVKRVRGEEGTAVKLTMYRPAKDGEGKEYSAKLTREMIKVPNFESRLEDGVGYIRLYQFNTNSADEIRREIEKLTKKGAKSFVLDLRDNPGGLLDQAVDVTSLFVKEGAVVKVKERNKDAVESRATGNLATKAPLVVLINQHSASASEIVAGALQDYKRATLVGEKSFGKGSVQTVEQLSDGDAVKFTIAHYLTPKNRSIDGKGLKPDVVVKMSPEKQADAKTDKQLIRALEIARQKAQ